MITPTGPQISGTIREIWRPLLLMFLFDVAVVVCYVGLGWTWIDLPHVPLSILGVAMGVILSFRNTSTYQRWWEARTLWGSIVNYSRTLARQAVTMIFAESQADELAVEDVRRRLVYLQIAYVHSLRRHLRQEDPLTDLAPLLGRDEIASLAFEQNVPMEIQRRMGTLLQECFEHGWIDSIRWRVIDETITSLANAQGGAERIKTTPFPQQYDYLQQLFVRVYCVLLPLGMVPSLGIFTPVGSSLIGFFLMVLDRIGRDLEEPFGNTVHDVPVTSICQTIEINLRQQLNESDVPSPERAVQGVLW